jgi:predicted amidohydrolase
MSSTSSVIAAAQLTPVAHCIEANVAQHVEVIEVAARHGVNLLVFPELSLTGYESDTAAQNAILPDDIRLTPLRTAALRAGLSIMVGLPVLSSEKPFIGALVMGPDHDDLLYTKQYLHEGEDLVFQPGQGGPMLEFGHERLALAVCADTTHPEHAASAAQQGASMYMVSALITPGGFAADSAQLQAYARSHRFPVLLANHVGRTGEWATAGRSTFWSCNGEIVVQGPHDRGALVIGARCAGSWQGQVVLLD